jgi:glycosyltransferase involved in cell wall biosynthesis
VPEVAGEGALLVPPGDAPAAARELERLAREPELRARLVEAGLALVRAHTLESESARVAQFLAGQDPGPAGSAADRGSRAQRGAP